MEYSVDYSGNRPEQSGVVETTPHYDPQQLVSYQPPRRRRGVPSIVVTIAAVTSTFALMCAVEGLAPVWARPSTWLGTFNARVESEVKAAETAQQAKFEAYVATVKLGVEQQNEQYRALSQSVLKSYEMQGQRAAALASAVGTIQTRYVENRMAQTRAGQGTDISVINFARFFGRLGNLIEEGSGDSALSYADHLNTQLSEELTDAAANGATIEVEGWDTGLPSAEEMAQKLTSLKPYSVPPPPRFDQDTDAYRALNGVSR